MLQKYLKKQNKSTLLFLHRLLLITVALITAAFNSLIVVSANITNYLFYFIGATFIFSIFFSYIKNDLIGTLKFNMKRSYIIILSFFSYITFFGTLSIINYYLNLGEYFYYLFGIGFILSLIKSFYTKGFMQNVENIVKETKNNEEGYKKGDALKKLRTIQNINESSKSLKALSMLLLWLSVIVIYLIVVSYLFYIKALIHINPDAYMIIIFIALFVCQNLIMTYSNKIKKIIINKNFEDGE